jgi:tetratricopeptide (TPR) repeat protein
MYASTLFFAPALVEAVRRWLLHDGQFRTAGILFATAICLLLMTRLQSRLEDWKSNLTLWQAASRCYPQCYGIKAQLAFALFEEKQYGDAYSLAEEALVQGRQAPQPYQQHIEPRLVQLRAKAEVNMREQARKKLLAEIHRQTMPLPPEESLKVLLSQSKQLSEEPRFHDVVGDAYMRLGRSAEALREYEIAAKLDPSCTEFRYKCDRARERAAGRKPGSARSPEKH